MEDGVCTAYALEACESRGALFVEPGTLVYRGMVIGENARADDMELNPVKAKALTNIRAAGKDERVRLSPPRKFTIEELISYVRDDEIIEITPKSVRLRKRILDSTARKTAAKSAKSIALKALQSGGKVSPDAKFLSSLTMV
uniref:TypA/BipA C-terminal domain-containing protein n=1 Tax=Lygus hesperus TaxID=30085 RepID=A0A0A9YRZ1_LYGHE